MCDVIVACKYIIYSHHNTSKQPNIIVSSQRTHVKLQGPSDPVSLTLYKLLPLLCNTNKSVCHVTVAPRIAQPPLSKKTEEGQVATFDCKYLGTRYPVTVVTWVKEDSPPLVSLNTIHALFRLVSCYNEV